MQDSRLRFCGKDALNAAVRNDSAFVGELIARKPVRAAAFGGLGAFLGFLLGVCIKVVACVIMLVCYIRCL